MILGGLSGKLCGEGLRGGKVAAHALPCKGGNGEGCTRLSSDKPRRNTRRSGEQAPFRAAELWRRRFWGSCGRICVVLRWKPACVIWKGGRAQTGDAPPAGEENAAGEGRSACGAKLRRLRSPWPCPSATAEGGFVGAQKSGRRESDGAQLEPDGMQKENGRCFHRTSRGGNVRAGEACALQRRRSGVSGDGRDSGGRFAVSGGEHAACVIWKGGTCADGGLASSRR